MKRSAMPRPTKPMRRVSLKAARERRAADPVVAAVYERDGGCVLRGHQHLAGPCWGQRTPHHLIKAWKRPAWTVDVLVTLCVGHNQWVEREPDIAWGLGLVVRNGETTAEAWSAMRNHGLAIGAEPVSDVGRSTPAALGTLALLLGVVLIGASGAASAPLLAVGLAAGVALMAAGTALVMVASEPEGGAP